MTSRRTFLMGSVALVGAGAAFSLVGPPAAFADAKFEVTHSDAEWLKILGPDAFEIMRREGTEPAGSSPLNNEERKGTYLCAGCALPLYSSETKFHSGTGWPSFYQPLPDAVAEKRDTTAGMIRTEIHCRRCGGHLGHVFNDGPRPTGLRYCMDGLALKFVPA
jgi:peptide-methionine (R)-S-oxide reductase